MEHSLFMFFTAQSKAHFFQAEPFWVHWDWYSRSIFRISNNLFYCLFFDSKNEFVLQISFRGMDGLWTLHSFKNVFAKDHVWMISPVQGSLASHTISDLGSTKS